MANCEGEIKVKKGMKILLMSHPSAGKSTFWRSIGGVDAGGHRGTVTKKVDKESWKGQTLEQRNARRGSGVKNQAFYKNCHVIDQPYSGCGVRSSQERYIKLRGGEKYSKKYKKMVCKNAEPDVKKGEHICYMGGKFHLPADKHRDITFLCVLQPLDIIERNCEARTEGGKFPNRRWANVDRVLEYRDDLEDYASKYNIPKFKSFKEALDSIL